MKNLKVGDRVRVKRKTSRMNGKEGTIWKIERGGFTQSYPRDSLGFSVRIDGVGTHWGDMEIAFVASDLEPLVPPDELAWQKFREHLRPNPLVIFDADPIIVSTDEEAARIAETVPNSHIKVVIRGVVVSEYYGQSQTNRP